MTTTEGPRRQRRGERARSCDRVMEWSGSREAAPGAVPAHAGCAGGRLSPLVREACQCGGRRHHHRVPAPHR